MQSFERDHQEHKEMTQMMVASNEWRVDACTDE